MANAKQVLGLWWLSPFQSDYGPATVCGSMLRVYNRCTLLTVRASWTAENPQHDAFVALSV